MGKFGMIRRKFAESLVNSEGVWGVRVEISSFDVFVYSTKNSLPGRTRSRERRQGTSCRAGDPLRRVRGGGGAQ